jgi:hypothetical protein
MNDEVLHTAYSPMCQYLFNICCGPKNNMLCVLYGINACTKACEKLLSSSYEFIYVTTKGGENYNGALTMSLEQLSQLNKVKKVNKVVICSMYVSEISEALIDVSISKGVIYYYNLSQSCINPIINSHNNDMIHHDDISYCFYDLACNLPTFDCVQFCILAELKRIEQGRKFIHFVIVPDRSINKSNISINQYHSNSDTLWRITHIVEQVFSLLPSVIGISSLTFREQSTWYTKNCKEKQIFPLGFLANKKDHAIHQHMLIEPVSQGKKLSAFKAHDEAVKLVTEFMSAQVGTKLAIVITLREYDDQPQRNSNYQAWSKFLNSLDSTRYHPVIVRDTYKSSLPLPNELAGFSVFPLAAIDTNIRVALYEQAYINMAKTNGAFYICNFIPNAKSITFIDVDDSNPTVSTETWGRSGYYPGEDAFLRDNNFQKIVWDNDSFDNIQAAFLDMEEALDNV